MGEAVKRFGSPNLRKRNTVGVTPWGMINNNNNDLVGRDVSVAPVAPAASTPARGAATLYSEERFLRPNYSDLH